MQHEEDEPILLDETPIKGFESFFLERVVKETLSGNHFEFVHGSATFQLLKEIANDQKMFVPNSKQLAINFHAARDRRIKPGAIILIRLISGQKEFFSLLKYDREQVIAYSLNNTRAVLEEIVNSFTSSKNALQKSALIELNNQGGDLVVVDSTVGYDITDFFRGFLNVRRIKPENEMTQSVHDVILKTTIKHKSDLPKEITGKIRSITFQAIQGLESFNDDEFFDKVFGSSGNQKIRHTYKNLLRKEGIEGDSFKFIKNAIKPPKERKFRTSEGVKITVGQEAENTITIEHGLKNEQTIITIKTDKLIEE